MEVAKCYNVYAGVSQVVTLKARCSSNPCDLRVSRYSVGSVPKYVWLGEAFMGHAICAYPRTMSGHRKRLTKRYKTKNAYEVASKSGVKKRGRISSRPICDNIACRRSALRSAALRCGWVLRVAVISSFFMECSQPTSSVTVTL